jgi:hypothetical protein
MKKQWFTILVFCASLFFVSAQEKKYKNGIKVPCPICTASGKVERVRIPPPEDFLLKSGAVANADIVVDYVGFSDEAHDAFEYAVNIWETIIESDIPIRMEAVWSSSLDDDVLGSCGPETYYSNFTDAPFKNKYYPVAIAEKIAKQELNGESRYDISATFNKNFAWYYGTDLNTPDTLYDFVTVVLHEIGHGLGFTGFFSVSDDVGAYGYYEMGDATSFDNLVQNKNSQNLVDTSFYDNVSKELANALESLYLYANSPVAKNNNYGIRPRLYAPSSFSDGSSVYHLNDNTYDGTDNSLMTHAVGKAEAIHDPGPLTRGIMDDIGWRNLFIRFDPPKDMEEIEPITFNVSFETDYDIDSSSLYVIYSNDGFVAHLDTMLLEASDDDGVYSATLVPANGLDSVTYFVQAADVMDRIRTSPSDAPEELYSVKFGADTEKPVITHSPIPYFLLKGDALEITANADDNFGIDTVYVEYTLNDVNQTSFPLFFQSGTTYSGVFNFTLSELKDGDVISYTIVAKDSASTPNIAVYPESGSIDFKVEQIASAVSVYSNDFNEDNSDFVLSDYIFDTPTGFENGALHSLHPYLSPNVDNEEFNYTTFLKTLIIIQESGTMSFDEVVLVEPGESLSDYGDDDFWDYVIVEGSKDFGETWLALADGYDSGDQSVWKTNYNEDIEDNVSQAVGSADLFFNREISLTENGNFDVGDTILIRFRLYSDPYASGWGWAIDNLSIQMPLSANVVTLSSGDVKVYPNPFSTSVQVKISALENISEIKIEVFDLFGRKVYSDLQMNVYGELNESIDLSHLGSGIFLIKVSENERQLVSKKLIKN